MESEGSEQLMEGDPLMGVSPHFFHKFHTLLSLNYQIKVPKFLSTAIKINVGEIFRGICEIVHKQV